MTDVVTANDEENYYHDSQTWNDEIYQSAKKSVRQWRVITIVCAVFTGLALLSLALLVPLKTAVPYVIRVDNVTGVVDIIEPLKDPSITQDEAITKYFIVKYLNAREQYDYQRAEEDYTVVSKLSSDKVFQQYAAYFNPTNEESPLNRYGAKATISLHIRDIAFLDSDTAIIHVKRTINQFDEKRETYWAITLSFQYVLTPKLERDRFINPLGFQVINYRIDPEVIEEN